MKKVLVLLLLAPAWSTLSIAGGRWVTPSISYMCGPERICVEWDEPGGEMDGAVCCIDEADLSSRTFLPACQVLVRSPRSD